MQAVVVPEDQQVDVPPEASNPDRFCAWWVFDRENHDTLGLVVMEIANRELVSLRLTRIEIVEEGATWPDEMQRVLEDRSEYARASGLMTQVFEDGTFPEETIALAFNATGRRFVGAFEWPSMIRPPAGWDTIR